MFINIYVHVVQTLTCIFIYLSMYPLVHEFACSFPKLHYPVPPSSLSWGPCQNCTQAHSAMPKLGTHPPCPITEEADMPVVVPGIPPPCPCTTLGQANREGSLGAVGPPSLSIPPHWQCFSSTTTSLTSEVSCQVTKTLGLDPVPTYTRVA